MCYALHIVDVGENCVNVKKSIISSIFAGAVFAISFVLAKNFISKRVLNSKKVDDLSTDGQWPPLRNRKQRKEMERLDDIFDAVFEESEREHKKVTFDAFDGTPRAASPTIGRSMGAPTNYQHTFFIDYPKSSIVGSTSLIYNNMVMIDSGSFTRSFGMDSLFNREKSTLTILYGDNTLIYNLKNGDVKFNNEAVKTDQYAVFFNDLIFIPLPFTAEIFGIGVKMNDMDRIIEIG